MTVEHEPTATQLTRSVLTDTCPFALARTHFCLLPAQTNLILQQSRGRVDREPSRHLLPFTSYWPEGIAQVSTTGQVRADPLMLRSLQAPLTAGLGLLWQILTCASCSCPSRSASAAPHSCSLEAHSSLLLISLLCP